MAASALLATPAQLELVSQPLLLAAWCSDSKMELVAGAGGWSGDTGTGSVHLLQPGRWSPLDTAMLEK